MGGIGTRLASAALLILCVLMLGLSVWAAATGGGDLLHVSIRTGARPFFVAGVAIIILTLIAPDWRVQIERLLQQVASTPTPALVAIAIALASAVLLIGLRCGSSIATASDSYGYITQAQLWQHGHGAPRLEQPVASTTPWPDALYTYSPLGYRPAADQQTLAPVYPPGYPMLMAVALAVFGQHAYFLVVPLLAAFTVFLTFKLGQQTANVWVGLIAAIWLCASPSFLFQTVTPMSDVPAMAAWTLALLLLWRTQVGAAIGAGICIGLAILIRPNLAPVSALLLLIAWRRAPFVIAGMLPGVLALAWLNRSWYGSPFASGYGDLHALFAWSYFPTNLRHYASWLWETQTPAVFAAPLAIFTAASSRDRVSRAWLLAFFCAIAACYACYHPFDTWDYLRFLLPAYPALLILTAALFVDIVQRTPRPTMPIATLIAITLIGTIAFSGVREARAKGVFDNWRSLQRFVDIPEYARTHLPPNAIYLTRLYSGSLRYYAGRPTLRWDVLDPSWLDRAISYLREQGQVPLIVIESGDEDRDFRERFHGSHLAALDWPPTYEYHGEAQTVRIYDPALALAQGR